MRKSNIAIRAADPGPGPVWSREVAERLFLAALDTDPNQDSNMATLVQALASVAPPTHQELMRRVALRTCGAQKWIEDAFYVDKSWLNALATMTTGRRDGCFGFCSVPLRRFSGRGPC